MVKVEPMPGNSSRQFKAEVCGQTEYFYTAGAAMYWAGMVDGIKKAREQRGAK